MDNNSLEKLWEEHVRFEFQTKNTEDTLATMVDHAYVNHIPVLTGGNGQEELREFYSNHFISRMPPDTEIVPVSRTIGTNQLVDEMIFKFTHTVPMDWSDMKSLGLGFMNALEKLQPKLRSKFRLGQKDAWKIIRFSKIQNDNLSGVMIQFEGQISVPCTFTDINIDGEEFELPSHFH